MIDRRFVEAKLSYIQTYYQELEGVLGYSDQEIKGDVLKLRALERVIQLIVDEIIDINNHKCLCIWLLNKSWGILGQESICPRSSRNVF